MDICPYRRKIRRRRGGGCGGRSRQSFSDVPQPPDPAGLPPQPEPRFPAWTHPPPAPTTDLLLRSDFRFNLRLIAARECRQLSISRLVFPLAWTLCLSFISSVCGSSLHRRGIKPSDYMGCACFLLQMERQPCKLQAPVFVFRLSSRVF